VLTWWLQVQTQLANHVAAVGPAVLVGLACGVLGTAFTVLNVKIIRLRDSIIQVTALVCLMPAIKIYSGQLAVSALRIVVWVGDRLS